jgi:hypothetical protein
MWNIDRQAAGKGVLGEGWVELRGWLFAIRNKSYLHQTDQDVLVQRGRSWSASASAVDDVRQAGGLSRCFGVGERSVGRRNEVLVVGKLKERKIMWERVFFET